MMNRLLLFILILVSPFTAFAELPAQLENDFSPLEGYVVMPMGNDDYLIDLDASKGVRAGDIFSIIHKGETITHPVTGEIIGTLDGSNAYLQVTRLKSGYSYAHSIGGNVEIKKGDKIERFNAVPALFIDKTADSYGLSTELQNKLPQLDWLSDQSSNAPLLTFERNAQSLTVTSAGGITVSRYPMPLKKIVASPKTSQLSGVPVASAAPINPSLPQSIIVNQADTSKIWHGTQYKGEIVGLQISDFNNDGQLNTAILLQDRLAVGSYAGTTETKIADITISGALSLLAIDSFDLNGNGKPEIFISAVKNGVPASRVYELSNQELTEIARDLPILFRRIDHPQKGAMLLGQKRLNLQVPFSKGAFQVEFTDGIYKEGTSYSLPGPINIYNFLPFTTASGDLQIATLGNSDYLKILTTSGEDLFESPDRYGGSEVSLQLQKEASDDLQKNYFLPQRLIMINGEILTPQNDGQRVSQGWRKYKKSRVISLKWNGLSLDESWRTSDQSGQTADIAFADIDNDGQNELVLAVKFARKGIFSTPKSAVVVYEMN